MKSRGIWLVVAGLLGIQAGLLGWSAWIHSPTLNEPGHLVAGISNWQSGRFDVYRVNPPLVRLIAAFPVIASGAETNWERYDRGPGTRPEFALGEDFVAANGGRSFWLFTLARWVCIPFALLGGYVCFLWGRALYGSAGGLFSLALWSFCPNILGHGMLITSDVAATSLGVAACYTFWCWLKKPTWGRTFVSGVILGMAELAKTTLVIFLPLWFLLWLVYRWPEKPMLRRQDWLREIGMLSARILLGIYVINVGYGFENTFKRLGDFQFVSEALTGQTASKELPRPIGNRFAGTWLAILPVPFPENYILGMDLQKFDFEHYPYPSYLRGELRERGWWYYYLYALAIKVPLGIWFLVALAATRGIWARGQPTRGTDTGNAEQDQRPVKWRDEFVLLCPPVAILAFVSSQTGFNEHMRYVLPAFPFVLVWIGRLAPAIGRRHWVATMIAAGALAWSVGSSLWVYPHNLSYFNELGGGPKGGPRHLIHSNVDWGQDLLLLKNWLDEHPEARPLKLAYFGYFDPKHAGIDYTDPQFDEPAADDAAVPRTIPPGWYAISVNFVRGYPHQIYVGDGSKRMLLKDALIGFQKLEPVAMAGYSIYIYHVE